MHRLKFDKDLSFGERRLLDQAKSLVDDGIPVAPLPLPVTPPNQVN